MAIYVGSNQIVNLKLYIGNTPVSKVYLGNTQIFPYAFDNLIFANYLGGYALNIAKIG